jgi:hypothetical protein
MAAAGIYLYRRRRLVVSLPLALPWLLFPVITQGDQIIDNLSINWMRFISHLLLGALFGFPVAVVVMAARHAVGPSPHSSAWTRLIPGIAQLRAGQARQGAALLAAWLLVLEMWVAVQFLGLLMVVTLIVMIWAVLAYGFGAASEGTRGRQRSERFALVVFLVGVVASAGLFFGYKNRPGAYQGSPSYYMDPTQRDAGYSIDRVVVPSGPAMLPGDAETVRRALSGYARAFEQLLAGYYILDRNYNYDFHNRLFLRSTPLLAGYRAEGLRLTAQAVRWRSDADALTAAVAPTLTAADPLGALLEDVRLYAAFTFERVPVLERMSAQFEQTESGLQHATHLYEGEGKVLGVRLAEILDKHRAVLAASAVSPVTSEFVLISNQIHAKYANRIVGF